VERVLLEAHVTQILARHLHRLLDRERQLAGFAVTVADAACAVADHRERRKAELSAALDDLGDAVDRDELFLEFFHSCHDSYLNL
jgi:hypothetical protein